MEPNETISPSAYALLMMKSHTSIPYAREAAALSLATQSATATALAAAPGFDVDPVDYWTRVLHFESRYWSINQLLENLTATNILEISSGFSFRGLDLSNKLPVYYIDTDLPNIITGKQRFIDAFTANQPQPTGEPTNTTPGHYELHPLNALDPAAFDEIINKFPPGPLTIVNEGLLVYFDDAQKQQLAANIRKALLARGGHWITADIYLKRKENDHAKNDAWRQWSKEHDLEEKKFESFQQAETFFQNAGFIKEKEATQDYSRLTSFPQFLKATSPEALNELRRPGRPRVHGTWRLSPRA
jgi:O-methyltransferase involved in polyketide biosynthesis